MPESKTAPQDLKHLEDRVRKLHHQLQQLTNYGSGDAGPAGVESDELWIAFHRPGWTTPRAIMLMDTTLHSMQLQADALLAARSAALGQC